MIVEKNNGDVHIPYAIKTCKAFHNRLLGLMFRTKPIRESGIWLIPCNSIHMFFMFFPIDVVFLDKDRYVVAVFKDVKPWRVIPPVKNAHSTLELPTGTIQKFKITVGDRVNI